MFKVLIRIIFIIWAFLCLKAFYNLVRGIGTERIYRIFFVSYHLADGKLKILLFNILRVRHIPISDIEQILPFSELKEKTKIYLIAEHWEQTPFKPMVCLKIKSRWLLLSPDNINVFIDKVKEQFK